MSITLKPTEKIHIFKIILGLPLNTLFQKRPIISSSFVFLLQFVSGFHWINHRVYQPKTRIHTSLLCQWSHIICKTKPLNMSGGFIYKITPIIHKISNILEQIQYFLFNKYLLVSLWSMISKTALFLRRLTWWHSYMTTFPFLAVFY